MSVFITDDCINCSACETECPVHAILPKLHNPGKHSLFLNNKYLAKSYQSFDHYYVNPSKCNECRDYFQSPRCNAVCPVSCCVNPCSPEDTEGNAKVIIKVNPVYFTKISLN